MRWNKSPIFKYTYGLEMWYEKDEPKLNCTGHNHAHASDGLLEITPTPKINIDEVMIMISLLRLNHAHASDGLLEITPTPKINIDEVMIMIGLLRYTTMPTRPTASSRLSLRLRLILMR